MRWLDEQKRVFGLIYWVDLILLFAALLVVTKAIWSFWPSKPVEKEMSVYITIEADNLHPEVVNSIQPGAWLRDSRGGVQLGTIIRKKVAPHYIVVWESKQAFRRRAYPERMDMRVTLRQKVHIKQNEGCFIGSMPLRAGRKGIFYTMLAEFKGEVVQVAKFQTDEGK